MGFTYLQNGLDNRPAFNLPGAKRILFIKSDAIAGITTAATDPDLVEAVQLRQGQRWNLFNEPDGLSYNLTAEGSKNGVLYGVEVGFTVAIQTRAKNRLFDTMRNTDLTAVLEDNNHRWWLLGLEQPLRLTTQDQKVDGDTNSYTLKLTGKQRENVKEMSSGWTQSLTSNLFNPALDSVDGGALSIQVSTATHNGGSQTTQPGTQLPNHFQTTVTVTTSGYIIPDSIGMVFASPGITVKLPAVALNGQQHTVKDGVGTAGTSSITVNGNGRPIDGNPEVKINTDFGAITFTYANNAWLTTAFVN